MKSLLGSLGHPSRIRQYKFHAAETMRDRGKAITEHTAPPNEDITMT